MNTKLTTADVIALHLNCTSETVMKEGENDPLLGRTVWRCYPINNMIFFLLEEECLQMLGFLWTPISLRQSNTHIGTVVWERSFLPWHPVIHLISNCSSFILLNQNLIRMTDGESMMDLFPGDTNIPRSLPFDFHYYNDPNGGDWLAMRLNDQIYVYDIRELLSVPLPFPSSTSDLGTFIVSPVHQFQFDVDGDVRAIWLHEMPSQNGLDLPSQNGFGRAGVWLVSKWNQPDDVFLVSGKDGSLIRRWPQSRVESYLDANLVHDSYFSICTQHQNDIIHLEWWKLSSCLKSALPFGQGFIDLDQHHLSPPHNGWTLKDGAEVVLEIKCTPEELKLHWSDRSLHKTGLWVNHEWIALQTDCLGTMIFFYLGSQREHSIDRSEVTGLPLVQYDEARIPIHDKAFFPLLPQSLAPFCPSIDFVHASSEWIVVGIQDACPTFPRCLFSIIFSYYYFGKESM